MNTTRNLATLLVVGLALCACTDGSSSSTNGSSGTSGTVDAGSSSGQVTSSSGGTSSASSGQVASSSASSTSGGQSASASSGQSTSGQASSSNGVSSTGGSSSENGSSSGGSSGSSGPVMGTLGVNTVGPAGGDLYVNGVLQMSLTGNGDVPLQAGVLMNIEMKCGDAADRKLPLYQDGVMIPENGRVNFLDRDSSNPIQYPKNICGGWLAPGGTGFTLTAVKTEEEYEKAKGLWKYNGGPTGNWLVVDGLQLYDLRLDGTPRRTGVIAEDGSSFSLTAVSSGSTEVYTWQNDAPCQ